MIQKRIWLLRVSAWAVVMIAFPDFTRLYGPYWPK
jgi:hypothetical protein